MKIIFAGSKTLGVECLKWLMAKDHEVLAVFGKARENDWEPSLREAAEELNLPFYDDNINDMVDKVESLRPDYLFSVQYGPILKKPILETPRFGCWNLHCGDLPRYAGCKVVLQAVWNGERNVGITFHKMDEGIDTGPPLCKGYVHIDERTAKELYPVLNKRGLDTFQRGVQTLEATNKPTFMSYVTPKLYYRMSAMEIGIHRVMQWDETMEQCRRRYAAFTMADGSMPVTSMGEKVADFRVEPNIPVVIKHFGEVIKIEDGRHFIAVRDGVISCVLCPR